MKLKNLTLITLLPISSLVHASIQLTSSELIEKQNIIARYQQSESDKQLKQLHDDLTISEYNINNIQESLTLTQNGFTVLSRSIADAMNNQSNVNDLSIKKISDYLTSYNVDTENLALAQKQYDGLFNQIKQNEAKRQQQHQAEVAELTLLKQKIIGRVKKEANDVKSISFEGNTTCTNVETPMACINRQVGSLVSSNMKTINANYRSHGTTIENASLDMHGVMNYAVTFNYSIPFSVESIKEINQTLGLDEKSIKLSSNVEATFYINGTNIGTGKEVIIKDSYMGKIIIQANYQGKSQSSIEDINVSTEYYYPF